MPEFSGGYFTLLMNGIEERLLQSGYLRFVVSHQCKPDLIEKYPRLLAKRSVEGYLLVNSSLNEEQRVPVVTISGHKKLYGNTNIVVDHDLAAMLALKHLYDFGHRRIAFMKGPKYALDSDVRWEGIMNMVRRIGLTIYPELCIYLDANLWFPELGYPITRDLLERTRDFTAIFCFNDHAAIGAVRAIVDYGLRCPDDISGPGIRRYIERSLPNSSLDDGASTSQEGWLKLQSKRFCAALSPNRTIILTLFCSSRSSWFASQQPLVYTKVHPLVIDGTVGPVYLRKQRFLES